MKIDDKLVECMANIVVSRLDLVAEWMNGHWLEDVTVVQVVAAVERSVRYTVVGGMVEHVSIDVMLASLMAQFTVISIDEMVVRLAHEGFDATFKTVIQAVGRSMQLTLVGDSLICHAS